VLLVLDANQGQNALAQAQQFHAALGVTGLVLTKLDAPRRGGIVVAIAQALGCRSALSASARKSRISGFSMRARLPARWSTALPTSAAAALGRRARPGLRDQLRARQQALPQRARSAHRPELPGARRRDGVS